jgi:putative ABC transport system ATP-binding protein
MHPSTETPVIALRGICRIFELADVETHALSEIDLDIHAGEFVLISGPSGCGKSTLLGIIGLLDAPSVGVYELEGFGVGDLSAARRAQIRRERIGFVFQSFNLIGDLSVQENVELPLLYKGIGAKQRRERALVALDRVNMSHRATHLPAQLSGGQQQRVAVARAIVTSPAILLADEPTGNLDSDNGEQVMQLLMELHAAGTTLCMVTHDPRYSDIAQRTVRLFDGKLANGKGSLS